MIKTNILTEAAFFIVEVMFPLRNGCPGLVHDEVVVGRTAIAILARDSGEADTLPSQGVTPSAYSKLCVTPASLTPVRPEVPEAVQTSLTLLAGDSRLAGTLACLEVTLGVLAGLGTLTGQKAVRSVLIKAPVVGLALVTPLTL